MYKKLLLNADDFGWDNDATNAIIDLIESGKLHNTTVLANHASTADLLRLKKNESTISVGLHTCINEGRSLINTPSSLTNESCKFYSSKDLFTRSVLGKIKYADILKEIKLQYNFLREHDLTVSHADSHQHIHQYPFLGSMITTALKEVGVTKIRNCNPISVYDTRRIIIKTFCLLTNKNLQGFNHPEILITDFTDKNFSFEKGVPQILTSIAASKHQTIEWMCHPGMQDRSTSYLQRKSEYDFLKNADWGKLLQGLSIELSQFKHL